MTFEAMIEKFSPALKKIAGKMNGHGAFFDDEDLYQETLLHLWSAYREGFIEGKTDSYILQGCYFHLKNYLRGINDKALFISLSAPAGDEGLALEEVISFEGMTALEHLEGEFDTRSMIQKSGLTDREHEILRLLMEDMTVREVGNTLGISHVMVVRIKAGISKKLAEAYKKEPANLERVA